MSKITELREQRNTLWNETKDFLEKNRGSNGLVEASAIEQYERMANDVKALGTEIERLEAQAEMDAQLAAATKVAVTNAPVSKEPDMPVNNGLSGKEYNSAFWDMIRDRGNASVYNALRIGGNEDGGYTVPDEFVRPDRAMFEVA